MLPITPVHETSVVLYLIVLLCNLVVLNGLLCDRRRPAGMLPIPPVHETSVVLYGRAGEEVVSGVVWLLTDDAKWVCDGFLTTLGHCWDYGLQLALVKIRATKHVMFLQ
jgi:hypothetical protein